MRHALALAVLLSASMLPAWALTVVQEAKLLPADGTADDEFGRAVALDGDTAFIGSIFDDDNGVDSGSAYVFTRTAGVWTERAKLLPADGAAGDVFGFGVALDGNTAIISAQKDNDNGVSSGSAYVFTRTADVWTERAKLLPADGTSVDLFGFSVALDGDTAVISARLDDDNGVDSGSAYVFTRTGDVWTEQAKLLPADGAAGDWFGSAVALEGNTAVISAPQDDDNGMTSGSVYIFTRTGGVWTQQAKLLPADNSAGDGFGSAVALDGDTIVVGALHGNNDTGSDSGAAYLFTRTGGVWTEHVKLVSADGEDGDSFGRGAALHGSTAVISAHTDDDNGTWSGSAYVFVRTESVWAEQAKLLPADGATTDQFGWAVALDGDTVVISTFRDDDNGEQSGSAYVFRLYDDDVPATGVLGLAVLLPAMFGTGLYFIRRRTTS